MCERSRASYDPQAGSHPGWKPVVKQRTRRATIRPLNAVQHENEKTAIIRKTQIDAMERARFIKHKDILHAKDTAFVSENDEDIV